MRRLFIPGKLADTVTLSGNDAHHLGYTLRARVGERCVVVDSERQIASMEITGFTADTVTLRLVERLEADTEPPIRLTLAVCLLKADKMDFVVQKAVELNKKIFGIPAFKHTSTFRSIDGNGTWEEWMAPARPLDTNHRYDADVVDEMLRRIQEDPPELPPEPECMGDSIIEASVTNAGEEGE